MIRPNIRLLVFIRENVIRKAGLLGGMGGPEIDAMYGDDDVQGGATFKRGTGVDRALRARTRNHNSIIDGLIFLGAPCKICTL